MKRSCISKMLLSISILSMIVVGCGKDSNKEIYKAKLYNLKPSASISINEMDYKFYGKYVGCADKTDSDNWILHKNAKDSNLEVLHKDTACKLELTKVEIGTGINIKSYVYDDTLSNTLSATAVKSIKFTDKTSSEDIYVNITMTPIDYSAAPAVTIKISTFEELKIEPETNDFVYIDKLSSLSITSANPPEYTLDASKLGTKFTSLGIAKFDDGLDFNLKSGGKKAIKYFVLVNDLIHSDFNEINEFYTNASNSAQIKTIDINSDKFSISKEELKDLTTGIKTDRTKALNLKVVLVNTENGINSYSVSNIILNRG